MLLKNDYKVINDVFLLHQLVTKINCDKIFAFNVIVDQLDFWSFNLIGLSFALFSGELMYLPCNDTELNCCKNFTVDCILKLLQPILEDVNIKKIGYNMKLYYHFLRKYDIELSGIAFDVMIEIYVLSFFSKYRNLQDIIDRTSIDLFFGVDKFSSNKCNKVVANNSVFLDVSKCVKNVCDILRLHKELWCFIKKESNLKRIFEDIEMPLVPVLSRIERNGVLIDIALLNKYSLKFTERINFLESCAYKLTNERFNLSSVKQLQTILYEKHKIPILKRTSKGAPSTDELTLSKLSADYPIAKVILEYRFLMKLQASYVDKLPRMVHIQSKRLHTSYHQDVTLTGRLSSSDPNLQNIPVRNKEGRKIRRAFIAPLNFLILSADYSQIELRIMAHLSEDKELIRAFVCEKDIYLETASKIFVTPYSQVTDVQRRFAKMIHLSLMYGMSAFSLSHHLSITYREAKMYLKYYFARYPNVLEYIKETCKNASKYGYVSTLDGRKLYVPNINSSNILKKQAAGRSAVNATIQGTSAFIIKKAMIAIDRYFKNDASCIRMIMQVHDELVFEVDCKRINGIINSIKELMENSFLLNVPLKVKIGVGDNWYQAH